MTGRPLRRLQELAAAQCLGLSGRPAVGDTVTLDPDGPEPITGVVDVASDEFLGVRSATGCTRSWPTTTSTATRWTPRASTAVWQKWLTDLFPAPVPDSTSV